MLQRVSGGGAGTGEDGGWRCTSVHGKLSTLRGECLCGGGVAGEQRYRSRGSTWACGTAGEDDAADYAESGQCWGV
eukprot:1088227-Rhodomonas_salina.1